MTHEAYINPIKKRELPFCIWHYPRNIMWLYLTFLLIIGSAVADHQHAWETGNEYHFHIQSHTLTVLDKLANQFSGVYIKGGFTIQVKSSDTLQAVVSHTQYAPVHKVIPEGWNDAEVNNLKLQKLSMSEKPFEIKLKNGVIQDVLVDQDVPTWEVNLLKSIVSQLQIDIRGENAIGGRGTQEPDDNQPFGTFKVMEDSVGGKCEVVYDIMPLSLNALLKTPELVPFPNLRNGEILIDITKTKNYTRCEQRMAYRSGIVGKVNWGPESNDGLLSRLSTSRIIISGNLTRFTIQSSVTTNNIFVSSKIQDTYSGAVFVTVNLTLNRMSEISNLMPVSNNLVSTGNLVYTYNDPFSSQHIPNVSRDPLAARSSENRGSNSSSEESHINDDVSSSSLSNSSSNNEERDSLQPKLDDAPKSPILPFFFGDKDKSLVKDEENSAAARLIIWIASKMENFPDDMLRKPFTDILEQFTILVRLIRTMDVEQITELENVLSELLRNYNTSFTKEYQKLYNQTAWDVFCNAVTETGTGPALITIKNWIINKKLGSMQAADIIPRIPKVALTPTAEYINAFFELITNEQVRKQRFLNTTAPLSFAELVRYSQNNKSSIYYSVYGVGRTVSKHDNALLETYIPYMATQLREAINESDSLRIQTYIMALGNFGHPKVLSVFEPYLEGTLPVSKFQRLMMVITLNRLGENFPRVARSVAYKIYVNMMEAYELRCAAVYVIMKTNPPLSMLQRMAEFTNQDENHHVNSAVKTSIEMLADLKQPEFQSLANKARIARKLLNPRIYENDSQSIFQKVIHAYLNVDQTTILQTIGSVDNNIPKGVYFDIHQSFGGFTLPPSKLMYTVSHIRELLSDTWYQKTGLKNTGKKSIIEETIEKLGIKPDNLEQFEGNVFIDSILSSSFYPLDNNTFNEMLDTWGRYLESLKTASDFESRNINYLYQYDMTLGFPTESGLPFMYTLTIPKLGRISSGKALTDKNASLELTVAGHILSSEKLQSRIGFVTPFEHRHYIAGIDINSQIFIPAGLSVKKSEKENKYQIEIHPREYYRYGTGHMAIHHSVVPYTASPIVLSHMPVPPSNDTRLVNTKEPQEIEFALGSAIFAAKSDQFDTETSKKMGIEALVDIAKVFRNSGAHYKKFDIIVYLTEAQVNITLDGSETFDFDSSEATIPATVDKQPESEARKAQFLKEVSKDVKSAVNYVYDLSILTEDNQHVLTLAGATSRVNDKHQVLLYWNIQSPSDGEVFLEFCTIGYQQSSRSVPLNFNKATEQMPKSEFKAEMRDNEKTIRLKGNWTRTDDAKRMAMTSEIVENCKQEIKKGNIWTPTCKRASNLVNRKDHFMMSIDTDSEQIYTLANKIILFIKMFVSKGNMEMPFWGSANENTIDMDIKMQPDNNDAKISLRTSKMDVEFSLKDISNKEFNISNILDEDTDGSVCVLDKTQAVTFDEKIYPLKLGNCWHVMTTTYPKGSPFNTEKLMDIPICLRVMILAREMDDGSKQIRIILDDREIYLKKSSNDLEATVNGRVVDISGNKNHQENTFEIYRLDGMIAIFSSEHQIYAVYDGERILLHSSFKYLNSVRGLCGNYDLRSDNDFIVPKNCIVTKPEEFAATYALTEENCQGPALQNKQKAEQSTCISRLPRPSDVISDREAGRSPNKNRRWSYH
ncbi:vitellogenin-1-like [Temnothorax americanus]|uniref:vitellogenin-1-like n=1 Tax=Temnothorax americanus TaxID=1964332 RepID=UPI004068C796